MNPSPTVRVGLGTFVARAVATIRRGNAAVDSSSGSAHRARLGLDVNALASGFFGGYVARMDDEKSQAVPLADATGRPIVTTLRFKIPRAVGEGLQLNSIKRRARGAMVTDVRFDYDEKKGSDVRITCSMPMAIFLVGELRTLDSRAKAQRNQLLVNETARAVGATFKAIEDGDRAAIAASQQRTQSPDPESRP